jgi:AraC-like DNA-binding protein/mannose-6-phosphate isomerase-like protein (cupin superfamily)
MSQCDLFFINLWNGGCAVRENHHEFAEHWLHSPGDLEKNAEIWVVKTGKMTAKPNYKVGPRISRHCCVHFILEGNLIFEQEDNEWTLGQGDAFFMLTDVQYRYRIATPDKPLRMIWIDMKGKQAEALIAHIGILSAQPVVENVVSGALLELFERMCGLIAAKHPYSGLKLLGLLYELFDYLQERTQPARPRIEQTDWIRHGKEYMSLHYPEGIMIKDVVHYLGVDRSYFTRTFTERTGVNPKQYLQQIRMVKSAKLLEDTTFSVSDVADSVGFADLFSFTRAFTKHYGMSPLKYRQSNAARQQKLQAAQSQPII